MVFEEKYWIRPGKRTAGKAATVAPCVRIADGKVFAARIINEAERIDRAAAVSEAAARLLGRVAGACTVVGVTRLRTGRCVEIVPWYPGGDLCNAMIARGAKVTVEETAHVARRVGAVLAAVHQLGAAHGDVKPENILLDRPASTDLRRAGLALCDWDMFCPPRRTGQAQYPHGTPDYTAPEAHGGVAAPMDRVQKNDMYGLGATLASLLTHCRPKPSTIRKLIADAPPEVAEAIAGLTHADPTLRWCTSELLESKWLSGGDAATSPAGGPANASA